MQNNLEKTAPKKTDFSFFEVVAWAISIFVFAPFFIAVAKQSAEYKQLIDAFSVLIFSSIILVLEHKIEILKRPFVSRKALYALAFAYACALCNIFILSNFKSLSVLSTIVGASLLLASLGFGFVKEKDEKFVSAISVAFFFYSLFAAISPYLDHPLRYFAGECSALLLNQIGNDAKLFFINDEVGRFILVLNNTPYEVARECNGFGILTSTFVLSVLILSFRKLSIFKKILKVIAVIAIAFAANILRILSIVLSAPIIAKDSYHIMHESYGYIYFFAALFLTWLIAKSPSLGKRKN